MQRFFAEGKIHFARLVWRGIGDGSRIGDRVRCRLRRLRWIGGSAWVGRGRVMIGDFLGDGVGGRVDSLKVPY